MSIDENIMNFIYQENKQTTLPYQPGDIIPVRITKLVDYGAFCVTKDDYLTSGLIHISQIPVPQLPVEYSKQCRKEACD